MINGSHALWTRNNSTGAITQYLDIDADTTNSLGTGTAVAGSTLSASAYPLITGAGDVGTGTNSGPALWAVDTTGTLQLIPTTLDPTTYNATALAPDAMTATGWGTGMTAIG